MFGGELSLLLPPYSIVFFGLPDGMVQLEKLHQFPQNSPIGAVRWPYKEGNSNIRNSIPAITPPPRGCIFGGVRPREVANRRGRSAERGEEYISNFLLLLPLPPRQYISVCQTAWCNSRNFINSRRIRPLAQFVGYTKEGKSNIRNSIPAITPHPGFVYSAACQRKSSSHRASQKGGPWPGSRVTSLCRTIPKPLIWRT